MQYLVDKIFERMVKEVNPGETIHLINMIQILGSIAEMDFYLKNKPKLKASIWKVTELIG